MYAQGTILRLKDQREPDPETGEPFPYNEVEVIGVSPVSHDHKGEWADADADGVILKALSNFGGTLDEPYGKCKTLYEVTSVPEPVEIDAKQVVRVVDAQSAQAGETPEEVFAAKAPGTPPEPGQKRGRGGVSPLGEVRGNVGVSPLDRAEVATPPAPPLLPDTPVRPETPAPQPDPEPAPAGPPSPPEEPPAAPPSTDE